MKKSQILFKRAMLLSFTLLFLVTLSANVSAAGEVDTSFNASAYRTDGNIITSKFQPDGKLLIGGIFGVVNGASRSSVARLNADGTIDASFSPPDLYDLNNTANPGNVYKIALQSNGKIIVGGSFGVAGSTARSLIRLNTDGSLDNTFNNLAAQFATTELLYEINVRPDDSIYIGGAFEFVNNSGVLSSGLVRLSSNGVQDSTFQFARASQSGINIIKTFDVAVDNTVYASVQSSGNSTTFGRYNSNGSRDTLFPQITADLEILKILIQPDGKILLGGSFGRLNGFTQTKISRINPDGVIDTNFISGFNVNGDVRDIIPTPDGKLVIVGSFSSYRGVQQVAIVRINFDGSPDTSFNSPYPTIRTISTAAVQNDGKIVLFTPSILERLNPNGQIDNSFQRGVIGRSGRVNDIIQQPDGKIIAAGTFTFAGNTPHPNLVRYNLDGSVDESFQETAFVVSNSIVFKVALQATGKVLVAGNIRFSSGQFGVVRLQTDGSVDGSFTRLANITARDIAVLPDNRILVSISDSVLRLLPDGVVDTTFSSPNLAGGTVSAIKVQPDGKIIIVGTFTQVNATGRGRIARLNADGTLDTTFAPLGANGDITGIDVQPDGKIVVIGTFTGLNGNSSRAFIGRINSDGTLDTGFAPTVNTAPLAVKVQPDGKVLIGGTMTTVNGVSRNFFARLNNDGTLDSSFSVGSGANGAVTKITLQTDGKILLGGDFSRINGVAAPGIARLLNAAVVARTPFDFDGDGRADVSVFRPSNATWYLQQSSGGFTGVQFGISGDRLVPADYDGDGRTDVAVNRDGNWYLLRSSQGFAAFNFGLASDIPVPADYDGDGRADVAVFRPSNATWYLQRSSLGYIAVQLGAATDKPVPGDYNGDGKTEIAVFRPSNATWYLSTDPAANYGAVVFGTVEDKPVAADYDGDGKTDVAVFRPSNGSWYLLRSSQGFVGVQFGISTDAPTPADYDGDGKADIAVYRNGVWYLNRSTQGFTGIAFGTGGDQPVPNAFVR